MLLLAYIQRIIMVFKPAGIHQVYITLFNNYEKFIRETPISSLDEIELKLPIEKMNDKQLDKWVSDVGQLVLFNRISLFVSRKMKSYQESGFNIVSSVLGVLLLVLYTIFSFAVINFGLYKIDQHFYSYFATPSFFIFFYYSFNVLLFNQIQEVTATMPIAQIATMIESFYALFLIAILVSLVLTFKTQRVADEMNDAIKKLSELGVRVEGYIKNKYRLDNIDIAMEALQKLKASLVGILYDITKEMS